jgi:hypothetical protein
MSAGRPNGLSDDEFKICLDSLQRTADTSRRIFYSYVVVFGTLLIWALNAIVYPVEQIRLDQIFHRQSGIVSCLIALETFEQKSGAQRQGAEVELRKSCGKQPSSFDFEISPSGAPLPSADLEVSSSGNPLPADGANATQSAEVAKRIDLAKLDLDYMSHERQYQLDRSAEISHFSIPIIGTSSDRSWLWLINILLGPLFYYLIRDSAANLQRMLHYIYDNNQTRHENSLTHRTRLVLLSMVQIVSSSPRMKTPPPITEGNQGDKSIIKVNIMALILVLPIVLSALILYDWYFYVSGAETACSIKAPTSIINYLCHLQIIDRYSDFFLEPEFFGGFLTIPVFTFEIFVFLKINKLLRDLSQPHGRIRI